MRLRHSPFQQYKDMRKRMKSKVLNFIVDYLIPTSLLPLLYTKYKKYFDDKFDLNDIYQSNKEFFDGRVINVRQLYDAHLTDRILTLETKVNNLTNENGYLLDVLEKNELLTLDIKSNAQIVAEGGVVKPTVLPVADIKDCICSTMKPKETEKDDKEIINMNELAGNKVYPFPFGTPENEIIDSIFKDNPTCKNVVIETKDDVSMSGYIKYGYTTDIPFIVVFVPVK